MKKAAIIILLLLVVGAPAGFPGIVPAFYPAALRQWPRGAAAPIAFVLHPRVTAIGGLVGGMGEDNCLFSVAVNI